MAHRAIFETKPGVKFLITPDFIKGLDLRFTVYLSENKKELLYDQNPPLTLFLQYRDNGITITKEYWDYKNKLFITHPVPSSIESARQSLLSIIHLLDLIEHKRLYWYKF